MVRAPRTAGATTARTKRTRSRRARIPAPFRRLQPSIIRGLGPRSFLVASAAAALLLIGGSSYVLSRTLQHPVAAPPQPARLTDPTSQTAQVLGATTAPPGDQPGGDRTASAGAATAQPAATTDTADAASPAVSTGRLCVLTCIPGLAVLGPQPGFDLVVDTASASRGLLGLSIPFHVVRRGNLSAPIQPDSVSLRVGSSPTSLLRVQAMRMTDSDHGRVTVLNLGLPLATPITGQLTARSGDLRASANFSL